MREVWCMWSYSTEVVLLDGPTRQILAERELQTRTRLVPPAVVQHSRALGFMALTPAEFRHRLGARG